MQRRVTPELLDQDLGAPQEIAASINDLRHINDWFGGTRTSIALLRKVARQIGRNRLSLLDIGSGGGDVTFTAKEHLARSGINLDVLLLDRRHAHLPSNGRAAVAADALEIPFGDCSFDIVGSTLLAHHFNPLSLQRLCGESLRVARHVVVINDLIRSPIHLALVYLGLPLFRSSITWHDAPASVRAAYTVDEMKSLLFSVGARQVEITRHFLFRMGAILWK